MFGFISVIFCFILSVFRLKNILLVFALFSFSRNFIKIDSHAVVRKNTETSRLPFSHSQIPTWIQSRNKTVPSPPSSSFNLSPVTLPLDTVGMNPQDGSLHHRWLTLLRLGTTLVRSGLGSWQVPGGPPTCGQLSCRAETCWLGFLFCGSKPKGEEMLQHTRSATRCS